jgi:hypothetical protein
MTQDITRRGVLKALAAFAAAVPFASPGAHLPADTSEAVGPEIEEDETGLSAVVQSASTKLECFLRSHCIRPTHFARESGYTRQHLLRLRLARMEPTRRCVLHLTEAARRITGEEVSPRDLFDLTVADQRWVSRWLAARERARRSLLARWRLADSDED